MTKGCKFRGFYDSNCSDCDILGCDVLQPCMPLPAFRWNILLQSSRLNRDNQNLLPAYKTTRCHDPENDNLKN
jgi:hypothetical protein